MLSDLAQVPAWALIVLAVTIVGLLALIVAVVRIRTEWTRYEEEQGAATRRYKEEQAQAHRNATKRMT